MKQSMSPTLDYLYDCKISLYYYKENSQTSDMLRSLSVQEGDNHVAESSDTNSSSEIFNEDMSPSDENNTPVQARRGRPSSSTVNELMKSGLNSDSKHKCQFCSRSFPRAKSLQTHLRIHNGNKPFQCTFPECTKTFVQSGQRKTHLRLHAGDKPFLCTFEGCNARYTHPNRRCKNHPTAELKRVEMQLSDVKISYEDPEQAEWLRRYYEDRLPASSEALSSDMDDSTADRISPQSLSSVDASPLKDNQITSSAWSPAQSPLKDVVCNTVPSPKSTREQNNLSSVARGQKRRNYLDDSCDKENLTKSESTNTVVVVKNPYFITEKSPKRQCVIKTYSEAPAPNSDVFHNVNALHNEKGQSGNSYIQSSYSSDIDVDPETLEHAKALYSFYLHANKKTVVNNPTLLSLDC